jgi:hypothetical protein
MYVCMHVCKLNKKNELVQFFQEYDTDNEAPQEYYNF